MFSRITFLGTGLNGFTIFCKRQGRVCSLLLLLLFWSSFAVATPPWLTQNICDQLLKSTNINAFLHNLTSEAQRRILVRPHTDNPYLQYLEKSHASQQVFTPASLQDSSWVLHLPPAGQELWPLLGAKQQLTLLEGLEQAFARGVYDESLLETPSEVTLQSFLKQNTAQALLQNRQLAFSPILFLGAALRQSPIGVCRHYNLAMAGLLLEMGLPQKDLKLVIANSKNEHPAHLYLEIRIGQEWLMADVRPHSGTTPPRPLTTDESLQLMVRRYETSQYRNDYSLQRSEHAFSEENIRSVEDRAADELMDDLLNLLGRNH